MKIRSLLFMAIAASSVVACNDGTDSTTTTDSTSTTSATTPGTDMSGGTSGTINIRPDVSYVDLKSGKQVRLRVDTVTQYIVDAETSEPVYYYIDPSTSDTFDRSGQMVNNALIRGSDGNYTVDESRLKIKIQDDGDMKIKDGEGNKLKVDANDNKIKMKSADGSKEKIDGDKYKSKSDTGKIKIKH